MPLGPLSLAVLRSTSESVWVLDESGGTLWGNDRLAVLLDEPVDKLQGRSFADFSTDDAAAECFHTCITEQVEQRREMTFVRHGTVARADVRLIPFPNYDGSASAVLAMMTDVPAEEDRDRLFDLTGQIVAANKELEAFSYSVSHDLREPLRSIDGFSRILLERYGSGLDERGRDYLGRVRTAAQRMGHLIADMLTLARIARAPMSIDPVNISQIARSVCSELAESDRGRHVEVEIEDDLTAVGDSRLLTVVLTNLLGNAWKFTGKRPEGRIDVTGVASDTDHVFLIADNGAGFEMKYVEKLFRPFQRLHSDAEFMGRGVGLATVQRIIARHGGRVWAEATVGEGARVFISIPRTAAPRGVGRT